MKSIYIFPFLFLIFFSCINPESNSGGNITPPNIVSTNPSNNAVNIDLNYADLVIDFNRDMNPNYISIYFDPNVNRVVRWDTNNKKRLYIIFQESLLANTLYTFTLNPSGYTNKIQDSFGNPLKDDTVLNFTTSNSAVTQPVIQSTSLSDQTTDVAVDISYLDITFSQNMQSGVSFSINHSISHSYVWTSLMNLRINFDETLLSNTAYTFTLNTTGYGQYFRNTSNIRLKEDTMILFTTGTP